MKQFAITVTAFLMMHFSFAQTKLTDAQKAAALLKKMTLEEKVGQMTQVTLAVFGTAQDGVLDTAKLQDAVVKYKVGSMLNVTNHALTVDQWKTVITQIQDEVTNTRLKIPIIYGLDGIHGQTYTLNSTLFPQSIAMAATRDTALAAKAAHITAMELRASGVRWEFAPVLDCGRQELWSRFPESYGEDVFLGKTMGIAVIKAYQGNNLKDATAVASCMKHYIAYSGSRTGKDRTPIYLPEIEMREYYLPQFMAAIKAGAATIMINSSEINGTPVHASHYLLTDVLRKELGFKGVAVSDWEDIKRLYDRHFVASTPEKAVAMAVNAGVDMSMVPNDYSFYDLLLEAVKKGDVPMSRIDEAVSRILNLKMQVGLFDNLYPEDAAVANFGKPEYQQVALDAAHEAITLLKNTNNILPLQKSMKVLVEGPSAQSITALNGCWSYTWQGNQEQYYPTDSKTIYQTIADKIGTSNVSTTTAFKDFDNAKNYDTAALRSAAANADVIVLCLGENAYAESPGNTRDLALPDNQIALAKVAASTGKPVILILTEGRPRFITSIEPKMQGILMAYWSGKKTAEALADILYGDYNPDGILPFSYEKSMGEMVLYDRKPTEDIREVFNDNVSGGYDPLYPFGFGLSYTTFTYSDIKLSADTLSGNKKIAFNITITNSGSRNGKHTVELYTHEHFSSITPNMKRLRAFQKVDLKAGESKALTFILDKNDLAFVNADLKTVTEPGIFDVMIGEKKAVFSYK